MSKIQLPDIERQRKLQQAGDVEALRENLKKQGVVPSNPEREFPVYMGCTMGTIDSFIPPESDGKASILTVEVST